MLVLLSVAMLLGAFHVLGAAVGTGTEADAWEIRAPALVSSAAIGIVMLALAAFGLLIGYTLQKPLDHEEQPDTLADRAIEGIGSYDDGESSLIGDLASGVGRFVDWLGELLGDAEFDD